MKPKFDITRGFCLSLDPGTNLCGVALWKDGVFVASRTLKARRADDTVSQRVRDIVAQLEDFLHLYQARVNVLLSEDPQDLLLTSMIGAVLATDGVDSMFNLSHTISPTEWKAYARGRGASHPDGFRYIKGHDALKATGFTPVPDSADECDAILVFLAYKEKYGTHKSYSRAGRNKPSRKGKLK